MKSPICGFCGSKLKVHFDLMDTPTIWHCTFCWDHKAHQKVTEVDKVTIAILKNT